MNRQAFTFLTLFSLILVLSIYYIMLPPKDTLDNSVSQQNNPIVQLQEELNKKREEIINKNNDIIAEQSSSTSKINQALEAITETKKYNEQETTIVNKLKEKGYKNSFVEIDKQIVKVTIQKQDATKADASTVMKLVLSTLGEDLQVEVKFINE